MRAPRMRVLTVGDLHENEVLPFLGSWLFGERSTPKPNFLGAPGARAAAHARVGGYIPDVLRISRAKALNDVADESAVAALAVYPEAMLAQYGLETQHVLTVFQAIIKRGVSPRGAVPLASLWPPVPGAQLRTMVAANLVEVRYRAVMGGVDYPALRELPPGAYVVAPCPLARESMALAVTSLTRIFPRSQLNLSISSIGKQRPGKSTDE